MQSLLNDNILIILTACLAAAFFLFLWIYTLFRILAKEKQLKAINKKYEPIISQDEEVKRLHSEKSGLESKISELRDIYREKRAVFDQLRSQVAVFDEKLALAELGVYEPHFDFTDSETYKNQIRSIRERQKQMVSLKKATNCPTDWTVNGSKKEGSKMVDRQSRLSLRAFNNECDAAISNVRWNNVLAMEKRIITAENAINRENQSMKLSINAAYAKLKLEELRLTHEYREKQKAEKEERAEMARAEREEKKLVAEAEAAEREERRYQVMLEKARKEAGVDQKRISELETAIAEAHERSDRARAMAEMTRSGYVYIISNIGSFGEDVVKIGLTRRLEPDERVAELLELGQGKS